MRRFAYTEVLKYVRGLFTFCRLLLLQRVEKHFKDTKQDPKSAPWMYVRYFFIFSTVIVCWALSLATDSLAKQILLALPMGFACALVCRGVMGTAVYAVVQL